MHNILGKEFECINKITKNLPSYGIGDDCAIIPKNANNFIVSTDSFVEGVHFDFSYFKLSQVGERCAESALSDIAAMGGKALYLLSSISAPSSKEVESLSSGIKKSLIRHNVKIIGGDTTYSKTCFVNITVIGTAKKPVLRSKAKQGDDLYISGHTGLSSAGLYVLKKSLSSFSVLKKAHIKPSARLDVSQHIGQYASSMIDISDGLVSECYHLCLQSNVDIVIDYVPVHRELKKLEKQNPNLKALDFALYGGEDYELLYSVQKKYFKKVPGFKIGKVLPVTNNTPSVYLLNEKGEKIKLSPNKGFKHF